MFGVALDPSPPNCDALKYVGYGAQTYTFKKSQVLAYKFGQKGQTQLTVELKWPEMLERYRQCGRHSAFPMLLPFSRMAYLHGAFHAKL